MKAKEMLPGVLHFRDEVGVHCTLLIGERAALLVDTGYGLENPWPTLRSATSLPVQVILTHGHHDHALGARWYQEVRMLPQDAPVFARYTAVAYRERVLRMEDGKCRPDDKEEYLAAQYAMPKPLRAETIELGGLQAQVIPCPGHTPGSAVVYVPQRKLLLTGDNWNPCAWLFFPEALPIRAYRDNLKKLLALPFERMLCPHFGEMVPRAALEGYLSGLTEEAIAAAHPVTISPYEAIDTHELLLPGGQTLIFDAAKAATEGALRS